MADSTTQTTKVIESKAELVVKIKLARDLGRLECEAEYCELISALQNWYDQIGKRRPGRFAKYEERLDKAYTDFLKMREQEDAA